MWSIDPVRNLQKPDLKLKHDFNYSEMQKLPAAVVLFDLYGDRSDTALHFISFTDGVHFAQSHQALRLLQSSLTSTGKRPPIHTRFNISPTQSSYH